MFCNICLIVATIISKTLCFVNMNTTICDFTGVKWEEICRMGVDKMGILLVRIGCYNRIKEANEFRRVSGEDEEV